MVSVGSIHYGNIGAKIGTFMVYPVYCVSVAMSESDSGTTMFAFGRETVGDESCPVSTAGYNVKGDYLALAEEYDTKCRSILDIDVGVIEKEKAERAWDRIITEWEERARDSNDREVEEECEKMARRARQVKREAF